MIACPRSITGTIVSLNLLCCNHLSPRSTKGQEYCFRPSGFPKHHSARHKVFAQNIFVKFVKWRGGLISLVVKWGHRGNIKDWGAPGQCLLFVFTERASKNLKFLCYQKKKNLEKHWLDGLFQFMNIIQGRTIQYYKYLAMQYDDQTQIGLHDTRGWSCKRHSTTLAWGHISNQNSSAATTAHRLSHRVDQREDRERGLPCFFF